MASANRKADVLPGDNVSGIRSSRQGSRTAPAELRARRLARRNAAAQGREYRIDPEMQALFDSRFEPLAEGEADWVIRPGDKLPDCIG